MRIVFVNLHSNWMLLKNSAVLLFKNSAAVKHGYLLQYLLKHPEFEICNYINDRGFSIYTHGGKIFQKFLNLFSRFENNYVLIKNGIDPKKITILRHPSEIKEDDIVIVYNMILSNYRGLDSIQAFKVACMIHFGGKRIQYENIKKTGVNCLLCEVNLQHTSEIYRRFSSLNLPWVVHPFVFAERFKNKKPFKERQNKAFAVGTITYKYEKEFLEVYGNPCDQPIRKMIKDNPEYFKDTIDCYSQDYLENDERKTILDNDGWLIKLYKRYYNRTHTGQQKKYFSFDMVEKFNNYKMHIVGEEILGVPGIGYVEGMACGSAYIGLDSPMYRDLGLIPGKHYIAYDGTQIGLRNTVRYFQMPEHQNELEEIANAGYQYAIKNFNGECVAKSLIESLVEEQKKWEMENR